MTPTNETSATTGPRPANRKRRFTDRPRIPTLNKAEATTLKAESYTCVYLAGATEVVPRYLGDPTGVTPFFIGRSQSWADVVTSTLDRYSPTFAQALWFRLWLPTPEAAKQVEAELPQHLSHIAKKLRGKAFDLSLNVSLEDLELAVLALAEALDLEALNDEELVAKLRSKIAAASQL